MSAGRSPSVWWAAAYTHQKVIVMSSYAEERITSTLESVLPVAGLKAGAIVKVPGLHVPVIVVAYASDMKMWWSLPVATGDQPVLPGDYSLPVGIVPYRVHMAHPTYVESDVSAEILAQVTPEVLAAVKSASLDFLLGGDCGDSSVVTEELAAYREWLIQELVDYRQRVLYG